MTATTGDLFADDHGIDSGPDEIAPGAVVLRGRALANEAEILLAVRQVAAEAPFRHMETPGGFVMSVAMTNCGTAGWITDRSGYRYVPADPRSGRPWPTMPAVFGRLAEAAAAEGGFPDFRPDACLVNRYEPGARMSLHQDRDERDLERPIVSVSLGLPAVFQFGGLKRSDPVRKVPLRHGDVVVWGGRSRLAFHGILRLKEGEHPATGRARLNLTFRSAL